MGIGRDPDAIWMAEAVGSGWRTQEAKRGKVSHAEP
jgi:hypothetical protein